MLKQVLLLLFHILTEISIRISVFKDLSAFNYLRYGDVEEFELHLWIVFEFM